MGTFFYYEDEDFTVHHSQDTVPNPEEFFMHTHEVHEIYIFLHGRGTFRVEGTTYKLHRGDLLIMRKFESHCLEIDNSLPYERVIIHFKESPLNRFDPQLSLLRPFFDRELGKRNLLRPADFVNEDYTRILEALMTVSGDRRLQIAANLPAFLNQIRLAFENSAGGKEDGTTPVGDIIGYINRNLSGPLSLDGLCARFYISKPQLCRVFKSATGSTVWDYITVKRLMTARQMILSGGVPSRAALDCGFNDYSAFYRAYRKRFGCSPKENYTIPQLKSGYIR